MAVVVVLGPGVELPVDQADAVGRSSALTPAASLTTNVGPESRSQTRSVAALKNRTRSRSTPTAIELVGHPALHRAIADDDVDRLDAAQVPDDLGVDPGDRRELAGPVVAVVRPGDPGRRVRLPFGGHAIAERGGVRFDPM